MLGHFRGTAWCTEGLHQEKTTQDEQGPEEAAWSQLRANTKVRAIDKSPDQLLTLALMFE